ncbi:hypothetical protein K474DRAFT_944891 [Panus rudis PR-1116 ss-1]|nr:hypothetical protein K474DRAFT_944891 [Panus rudis PR-1116 ss-1]
MLALYSTLLLLPSLSLAYTFNFTSTPRQCDNLSVSISGSGGQPPYQVLIIPFGPSPLPNNVEARRITEVNFTGTSSDLSFQLKFPANSQFVAVVSDKNGFGTGGTSGAVTVLSGDDSSCFDSSSTVQPPFTFSIIPDGQIAQCRQSRIQWDPSLVQGTPSFKGVIPGGQSFAVPQGQVTTQDGTAGFNWTPSVRIGTTLLLLAGDNRGAGTGGSAVYIVNQGPNDCLNDSSPSSTPGSPAGGSYPTSTSGAGTGGSSGGGSRTNVGAIVGGVIAGVVGLIAILLILYFYRRRQKFHKSTKERPVDLLRDDENEQTANENNQLPQYYQPEPFIVPDPTVASSYGGDDRDGGSVAGLRRPSTDRQYSRYSVTNYSDMQGGATLTVRSATPDGSRSATPSGTNYSRKSPAPPTFRPVNIVQHEDAGPSEPPPPPEEEVETIELPPAYTSVKPSVVSPPPAATWWGWTGGEYEDVIGRGYLCFFASLRCFCCVGK